MQGDRATVASLSDLFDLEHGSSSSNNVMDWGHLTEDHSPENLLPSGSSMGFMNEHMFVDRSFGTTTDNIFSVGQSSRSRSTTVNLDLDSGFVGNGSEDSPLVECPHSFKPGVPNNQWFQSSNSSELESLAGPSGSGVNLAEENEEGPSSSSEGLRLSRKRKTFEPHLGQSSMGMIPDCDHNTEGNLCPGASSGYNGSRSDSLVISERPEPRLRLGARGSSSRSSERVSRNLRSRLNAPRLHSSDPMVGSDLLSSDLGLLFSRESSTTDMNGQVQPPELHSPAFPSSGLREDTITGTESSQEEASSSFRSTLENHPMFIAARDSRATVHSRGISGASIRLPRNFMSSQAGSSSSIQPPPVPNRPMHYPRRLSEYVRRSLSAVGSEPGGSSNSSPVATGPSGSSEDVLVSSRHGGSNNHARHSLPLRSSHWLERQGDEDAPGLPFSVRSFATAGEGRRRLASEIRSVLDMMRRGQGLRVEDFMILDQSVLFGLADTPDRHRDMRLDVDNMSYEELLALEERIGNVNTGLSEETILIRLKQRKQILIVNSSEAEPCCICQEEYNEGEDLGTLECGHDFHRDCIKQWLMHKNICPICKTTGLST